jgi:hypothetical protein
LRLKQTPFLHLDLGEFTKDDATTGKLETRFIWDAFERMGVAAVSPGPRELAGWSVFKDLVARKTIPVITSNVALQSGGPIGERFHIITVNGIRVALFSLMGRAEYTRMRPPEGTEFTLADPTETARNLVPRLRKQADLVVLMSQMAPGDTDQLLRAIPGIDVALYGQNPSYEEHARKLGDTVVQETGKQGKYLGELVLVVGPQGGILDFVSRNRVLDKTAPEKEEMAALVVETQKKAGRLRSEAAGQQKSAAGIDASGERFLGAEICRRCHERQFQSWATSPHGHALASLDRPIQGKPRTDECLRCHVTGYGHSGGYSGAEAAVQSGARPDLSNVQCETCHGPGSEHNRTGKVVVSELLCRSCHTPEWSPDFDYEKAMAAVKH